MNRSLLTFFLFLILGLPSRGSQTITTVAGGAPDGFPATQVGIGQPFSIAVDRVYNLGTGDLETGTYLIAIRAPDGRRFKTGFVLR